MILAHDYTNNNILRSSIRVAEEMNVWRIYGNYRKAEFGCELSEVKRILFYLKMEKRIYMVQGPQTC